MGAIVRGDKTCKAHGSYQAPDERLPCPHPHCCKYPTYMMGVSTQDKNGNILTLWDKYESAKTTITDDELGFTKVWESWVWMKK